MEFFKKTLIFTSDSNLQNVLTQFFTKLNITAEVSDLQPDVAVQKLDSINYFLIFIHIPSLNSGTPKLLRSLKSHDSGLSIALLSESHNQELGVTLIKDGTVDYVLSPQNLAGILSAVKNEIHKRELAKKSESYRKKLQILKLHQQREIQKAVDSESAHETTLDNLMTALDLRDVETFGHSRTVAKYSQILAQILGIKNIAVLDNIRKGALLHDVGKIAIPDTILKKPGSLDPLEWEKIKLHPSLGFGLIKEIKLEKEVGNIILYHHERYDGTGYLKRLNKKEIPLEARIFAVSDALDAITSSRPYRKGREFQAAKKEIEANSGTQFDPKVVEAFCSFSLYKWERIRFETTRLFPFFEEMIKMTRNKPLAK